MVWILPMFEFLFTCLVSLAMWFPTTPETSSTLLTCLGRNEVYFDFDYFTPGGHSRARAYCQIENTFSQYICKGTLVIGILVASNILDLYLLFCILRVMKTQTKSVASMLSTEALTTRQRYLIWLGAVVGWRAYQWVIFLAVWRLVVYR